MKRLLILIMSATTVLIFAGCIVQSVNPFYTKEAVCEMPGIAGEWTLIDEHGKAEAAKPWVFRDDKIVTYDEKGELGTIRAVYFRVGKSLFLDTTVDGPGESTSRWWTDHVFPVHVVTKVEIEGDRLTLTPVDYNWLDKAIKKGTVKLPHARLKDEDAVIFTASSKEWMRFLKKYSGSEKVFSNENAARLIKYKGEGSEGR